MRPSRLLIVSFAAFALAAADARAASVTLQPIRDNTLFESATGAISGGESVWLFCGRNAAGAALRPVLKFVLAGSVPMGARIDSVRLTLHAAVRGDALARRISLHRVASEWGEGDSAAPGGTSAPAEPGDATWRFSFYPSLPWTSPGGDFDADASAVALIGGTGTWSWSGPALTADVQAWLSDPSSNHGWLLHGDESAPGTMRRFDSRESNVVANRPSLTLYYDDGVGSGPVGRNARRVGTAERSGLRAGSSP